MSRQTTTTRARRKPGQRYAPKFSRALFDRVIARIRRGERTVAAIESEGIAYSWFYTKVGQDEQMQQTFARACDARDIPQLEDEAYRRAVEGVEKPVYQGGAMVGTVREYSDNLLTLLLKGRRPEIFHKPEISVTTTAQAGASVHIKGQDPEKIQAMVKHAITTASKEVKK